MNLALGDELCNGLFVTALLGDVTLGFMVPEPLCMALAEALSEALTKALPPFMLEDLVCGLGLHAGGKLLSKALAASA